MIVRIRHFGAERWFDNVLSVDTIRGVSRTANYLRLDLGTEYPYLVHYWMNGNVSVLVGETKEDITALLREERR